MSQSTKNMKIAKIALIIIGSLVALLLLSGLFVKKEYRVERSVVINAPANVVMEQVRSLKNMQQWSPWAEMDPEMKVTYSGTDGEVGSSTSWTGEEVGSGKQEVTLITGNRVETHLTFIEPWESESDAYIQLDPESENRVKVSWGLTGSNPYPFNVMGLFMDGMMGKDFERGLGKLKALCESSASRKKTYRGFEVHETEMQARTYIARKEEVSFDKIPDFYKKNFSEISLLAGEAGLKPAGSPSGIFYKWDEKVKKASMAAALPVESAAGIKNYDMLTIAGGRTLYIDYYGPPGKSVNAHYAMDDYMKEKGLKMNDVVIEEYMTDWTKEKDTTKWLTRIYYPVK
jgi:effector-binding domain-containing protein